MSGPSGPAGPPPKPPSRRGGARPGAGRKPGPSRLTLECQAYLDDWLGGRPKLFADIPRSQILMAAGRRCFILGHEAMARRFISASHRLDRAAQRRQARLDARLDERVRAALESGAPLAPDLRAEIEDAMRRRDNRETA